MLTSMMPAVVASVYLSRLVEAFLDLVEFDPELTRAIEQDPEQDQGGQDQNA